MTAIKTHDKLARLIDSLTIRDNQKTFLQEKAKDLLIKIKSISQNQIPYWSSLYLSENTYEFTIEKFWYVGTFDRGFFLKNRFDIDLYFVFKNNNTHSNGQKSLTNSLLFEMLYSNLKIYQDNHRESMKILKNPPYRHYIPIRMDCSGISILFDCIPAQQLFNGYLLIPCGIGGTKKINQILEEQNLFKLNKKQNGKIIQLIILLKYWNFNWGKPLKGDIIERLVEFIFDKKEIRSWDQAVKTFFNRAIHIIEQKKILPDRVQFFILNEYSSNELKNFLELLNEAKIYA
ncbi:MAG: hypothetical protein ACFE75_09270, partial [Candidatus Hodarchaeota archaeon]